MATRHRKPGPIRKAAETLLGGAAGIGAVTAVATVMHTGAGTPAAAGTQSLTAPAQPGASTTGESGPDAAVAITGDTPVSDVSNPGAPAPSSTGSVPPSDGPTDARIQYEPTHAAPTRAFQPAGTPSATQGTTPPPVERSRPTSPPTTQPSQPSWSPPTNTPTNTPITTPAPPTTTPSQPPSTPPSQGGGGGGGGDDLGGLLGGVLGTLGSLTGTVLGVLGKH